MTGSPRTLVHGPDPLQSGWTRILRPKAPEVTLLFWVVNLLAPTVAATVAHVLVVDLALELPAASAITSLLLTAALIVQFSLRRYRPAAYWMVVVVLGVVATLLHAIVVDEFGLGPVATIALFSVGLAATLACWSRVEGTLSIHTIVTRRREAFHWIAILFALALGTAIGDLVTSMLVLGGLIVLVGIGYRRGLSPVVAFWSSYVVVRPLGASLGTHLAAPPAHGGLGLGATTTSLWFLAVILLTVAWFGVEEHHRRHAAATRRARAF